MVAQSDLKYTWQVNEEAKLMKFYLWLYDADKSRITFCRWFWGTLLSPCTLLMIAIITPFAWLAEQIGKKYDIHKIRVMDRNKAYYEKHKDDPPRVKKERTGPPLPKRAAQGIVTAASAVADKISAGAHLTAYGAKKAWAPIDTRVVQPVSIYSDENEWVLDFLGWVGRITAWGIVTAVVSSVLFGLGVGFYAWQHLALYSLEVTGMVVAGFGLILLVNLGIATFITAHSTGVERFADWVSDRICSPIAMVFVHIGKFFAFGYFMVKTRTCPRVEVVNDQRHFTELN